MQQPKLCRAKVLSNQPCNRAPAAAVIRDLLARVRQSGFSRRPRVSRPSVGTRTKRKSSPVLGHVRPMWQYLCVYMHAATFYNSARMLQPYYLQVLCGLTVQEPNMAADIAANLAACATVLEGGEPTLRENNGDEAEDMETNGGDDAGSPEARAPGRKAKRKHGEGAGEDEATADSAAAPLRPDKKTKAPEPEAYASPAARSTAAAAERAATPLTAKQLKKKRKREAEAAAAAPPGSLPAASTPGAAGSNAAAAAPVATGGLPRKKSRLGATPAQTTSSSAAAAAGTEQHTSAKRKQLDASVETAATPPQRKEKRARHKQTFAAAI